MTDPLSDPRLTPANGRVAALHLQGRVTAARYTEGDRRQVAAALTTLWRRPGGPRDRQLPYGEQVTVYEEGGGFAFVQAARDSYVGHVDAADLGPVSDATHIVAVPATHLYPAPDLKRLELMDLTFGARLRVVSASGAFFETDRGLFVPKPHLRPANKPFADPATVAQMFFGVPYLWGGNSVRGIDCSGLVQAACLACHLPCPGDSDLQECASGFADLDADAQLTRGDLVFWRGHVGMMVDAETLIHANAHHMAVAYEALTDAVARIAAAGSPVTARRRPILPRN